MQERLDALDEQVRAWLEALLRTHWFDGAAAGGGVRRGVSLPQQVRS